MQWLHQLVPVDTMYFMATITRLPSCTITMYPGDHPPPHYHVRMNDGREALVEIATGKAIASKLTKRALQEAIAWAAANADTLTTKWKELNP